MAGIVNVSNHSSNDILNLQREETLRSHETTKSKRPLNKSNQIKRRVNNDDVSSDSNNRKNAINRNIVQNKTVILEDDDDDDDVIVIDDDEDNQPSTSSSLNNRPSFFNSQPNISSNNESRRRVAYVNNSKSKTTKIKSPHSNLSTSSSSSNRSPNEEEQTKNDEIFARQLQEQLDREYQNHIRNQSATRVTTPPRIRNQSQRHNSNNLRIPDSIQQDLLDCVVRENSLNQRINNRNQSQQNNPNLFRENSINYFNNGRNQSNSVSNLTQAFRFLNDESFLNNLLSESESTTRANARPVANLNHRNLDVNNLNQNVSRESHLINNLGLNTHFHRPLFNASRPITLYNHLHSNRDFTSDDYENLLRLDEINSTRKGLSKNELESLITFEFRGTTNTDSDNNTTCSICYEDFAKKDKLTALACLHKFHKKCIKQWLIGSRKCPLCQKDAVNGT